jgi:hypothetical protein
VNTNVEKNRYIPIWKVTKGKCIVKKKGERSGRQSTDRENNESLLCLLCFHINFLYGRRTILACEVVKGSAYVRAIGACFYD